MIRIKKRVEIQLKNSHNFSKKFSFIQLMFCAKNRTPIYNIHRRPMSYLFNKKLTELIKIKSN